MTDPTIDQVVQAGAASCRSLSRCNNFFVFEHSDSWLGWENWLTVDIVRRLNHRAVVRFGAYSNGSTRSDIFLKTKQKIAVEIKVNYIDDNELDKWIGKKHGLPKRVADDLKKLTKSIRNADRLMLMATALESSRRSSEYRALIDEDLSSNWPKWTREWAKCGNILLLSLVIPPGANNSFKADASGAA
jgi:hypothetical protein